MDEALGLDAQQDTEENTGTEQQGGGNRGRHPQAGGCRRVQQGGAEDSTGREASAKVAEGTCCAVMPHIRHAQQTAAALRCSTLWVQCS